MIVKHKQSEELFTDKFDNLFDIAHADAIKLINIEEDKQFVIKQRGKKSPGYI